MLEITTSDAKPHLLWSVGEVVHGLCSQATIALEKSKNMTISAIGVLKVGKTSVQQVDDSVCHTYARSIGKLQWIHLVEHEMTEVAQDEPLNGLHQVRGLNSWTDLAHWDALPWEPEPHKFSIGV